MGSILVIDDEPGIRNTVKDILEDERYRVFTAEDGLIGLEILKQDRVDAVLLDVWLPRMGGIDVLKRIREEHPSTEVIIISGHATIDMAVQAVKMGAFDFIEKPLSIDRILTSIRNALAISRLKAENARFRIRESSDDEIIGTSPPMEALRELIGQSARSDARVLITGENGTGKEMVARNIHSRSDRANGPFVEVNCAAIPETLIESELFGHEKGAFTDAVAKRMGRFEAAHGGTLFMDEVGDMSPSAQAKVLRVMQEMRFERLGGEESVEVDVRVIAATNKDLEAEIAAGRFREDLFFRLNVIPIRMPSLRERRSDIPALADHLLARFSSGAPRTLSPGAASLLSEGEWHGNVRELKNFMERLSVMSDEAVVSVETVRRFLSDVRPSTAPTPQGTGSVPGGESVDSLFALPLAEAKERFERRYLVQKFRENGYNVAHTAEALGMYPSNLHAKMRKFGIEAGE